MSIEVVEKQIERFLADKTPGVLAICGKWGVGKTYFWNETVKKLAASEETFKLPRYGYVSLFGINSLQNLKAEMFTVLVDRTLAGKDLSEGEMLKHSKLSTLKMGVTRFAGMFGPKLADLLLRNSSSIAESVCFATVRKSVVCFDDLERISKGLEGKDVLGLASLLKEQKKCKVVLLLNDEKDESLQDFRTYHEKVVDLNLRFEPTAQECAKIALKGDSEDVILLRECICKLNLTNIRTIKKIERVVNMVTPLLKKYDREIIKQAIHSITLFGWCHYRADDKKIPTIEHVKRNRRLLSGFSRDNTITDEEQKEQEVKRLWNNRIRDYGYSDTDELDLALLKGVTDGYLFEDELKTAARNKHDSVLASRASDSFHNAWKVYHESFSTGKGEVVDTLFQSFKDNVNNVSLANFNGMVMLFRELGEDDKADEAIELYIASRDPESEIFDLSSYAFSEDVSDQQLQERFAEVYKSTLTEKTLEEVLGRIGERRSWNPDDEVFLADQSVDKFYEFFKSTTGPQLPVFVKAALMFHPGKNKLWTKISENVTTALKEIAGENELNQRRMKMYGITLDE